MNNWQNWYASFLEDKRDKNLKAFYAGLNGQPYIPEVYDPNFNYTSSWSELISIVRNNSKDEFFILDYELKDGIVNSNNPIIITCFEKARKINSNFGLDQVLNYLIFNYLKSIKITDIISFIKEIREIPDEIFLNCNNCGFENVEGWPVCKQCGVLVENSFDD